ncbi:hypothetical protein CAPTEDRAFT_99966 [Capitella teleta]|uniref:Sugar phosphate phosphatase n=1 Tax=Capitella teleta TaxID=283909 RepID=R7UHZ8_CAPTE|nr:hypothetical protein CAPTEDRAFT_99966 [Capitella teleta]|eukprot:ELU02892.1 hypothetical protein CAPTEDRAFT_99966 [Capitella teleta]
MLINLHFFCNLRDFAYPTMKERVPIIITKALDTLNRKNKIFIKDHGQEVADLVIALVGRLSKLCYEVKTNKPLTPLTDKAEDNECWNRILSEEENPCWFNSAWLLTECYAYRRIMEAVMLSPQLGFLDPFGEQKREALIGAMNAIKALVRNTQAAVKASIDDSKSKRHHLNQLMRVCLWGNRCDLSISAGQSNTYGEMPEIETLDSYLLTDNIDQVWNQFNVARLEGKVVLHVVLDNAGFELLSDFCLADFLTSSGLVDRIHFHGKPLPWFVSDVTPMDWDWTLDQLTNCEDTVMQSMASVWKQRLGDGGPWSFSVHDFWCSPCDFSRMKRYAPDLHSILEEASLVIFKGDLNYRKLIGDLKWPFCTPFKEALRGFQPAPLCALRTIKCDTVVGLSEGQAEKALETTGEDWMIPGTYGVIQFSS